MRRKRKSFKKYCYRTEILLENEKERIALSTTAKKEEAIVCFSFFFYLNLVLKNKHLMHLTKNDQLNFIDKVEKLQISFILLHRDARALSTVCVFTVKRLAPPLYTMHTSSEATVGTHLTKRDLRKLLEQKENRLSS